jgi:hypothetical protein
MFKRNSLAFGASLGAVLPVFLYVILQEAFTVERNGITFPRFDQATSLVLSIAVNLIPFTRYMKKPEYEQTGKGILLVTFFYAAVFIFIKFFKETN